jgi:hypothetical protein
MLNSPTADQGGFCNLFSVFDLKQMANRDHKLMAKIKDANHAIITVDEFLKAYAKFDALQQKKLINTLEVRCIMYAFGKEAKTRANFANTLDIMKATMEEARKLDESLPALPALADLASSDDNKKKRPINSTLRHHGTVPDAIMEERGFKVGAIIYMKKSKSDQEELEMFEITILNSDETTITVKPHKDEDEKAKAKAKAKPKGKPKAAPRKDELADEIILGRADLHDWAVYSKTETVLFNDFIPFHDNVNLLRAIIEGAVKQFLLKEAFVSGEDLVVVAGYSTTGNTKLKVHATKNIKAGKLNLIPVTTLVSVSDKKLDEPWINIGEYEDMYIYVKGSNTNFLKQQQRDACKKAKTELVSKFWVLYGSQTNDPRDANCELVHLNGEITIVKTKIEIVLPKITNSRDIKEGDDVLVVSSKRAKK